jgi:ATP synthase protein I
MSDSARGSGDPEKSADEAALSARLRHLGERLGHVAPAAQSQTRPASGPTADPSGFARGFRLSAELVVGVLVGAGLGWLLDRWLGTLPWGMFVFALLGFTAGVMNVMRSAGAGAASKTSRDDR